MRFTIRELVALALAIAMANEWVVEHRRLGARVDYEQDLQKALRWESKVRKEQLESINDQLADHGLSVSLFHGLMPVVVKRNSPTAPD